MKDSLRLIYMAGGASFTLIPLKKILDSKHNLVQVHTKYPKPSGRGKKILVTDLQKFLEEKKIPFSCPKNLRFEEEIEKIKNLKPDIIVVFSYGNILPKAILDIPKWGCINIHASLLPKWRGASPVQYSLLKNEKETGFTIMLMNEKIDEGKILFKKTVKINKDDDTQSLLEKIAGLASIYILEVIEDYVKGNIEPIEQEHELATYSHIIKKYETYLDFNENADSVIGKIRAFNPNPGAKCFINGELVKIIKAEKEAMNKNFKNPGIILDDNLLISCKLDAIRPTIIQRAGKKPLKLVEVLNGWKITPGEKVKNKL
ncbi:methionyl-tRNA formyltransferase [Alphaproteobacteria bacterium]|nr:methionyl-tRNA formyltransferase [Alphaproteobacteria bacterium]